MTHAQDLAGGAETPRTVTRWDRLHHMTRTWSKGCTDCGQRQGDPHTDTCPKVQPR